MSIEFIVKFRSFDKVECCFDIVAVFWQQRCLFSICFDFVERTKFRSTLLPKNGYDVEATFDFVNQSIDL